MKRCFLMIAAAIMITGSATAVYAQEDQVAMQIISIPEQDFSTLVSPDCVYSYHPDAGLTIYPDENDEDTFVTICKTDAPGANFDAETYFNDIYSEMLANQYGTDLVNPGEYKEFPIAGQMMPGQMCTYQTGNGTAIRFCVFDLQDSCYVRYEAFGTDETASDAIGVLGVALGNFQPDADYYGSPQQAETEDEQARAGSSDPELTDDEISSSIMGLLTQPGGDTGTQNDDATTFGNDTDSQGTDYSAMYAGAEGDTLISKNGIELHVTRYKIYDYDSEASTVYLYVYAANDSDLDAYISTDNATVNGVPVRSTGFLLDPFSEYGDDSKHLTFLCSEEDPETSAAQIEDPRQIELDLDVLDLDMTDRGFTQHVSIDLTAFDCDTYSHSGNDDSKNDNTQNSYSGDTDVCYAPAYTPASVDFCTLEIGNSGQAVRDLQQRLADLGYLCDTVDGAYGKNTAAAVMAFNAQHHMDVIGEATPEMQELLYSSSAEYYVEPYIPLVIGPQFRSERSPYSDMDHGSIWIQVVNHSLDRAVIGYEIYYYQTDVYGDRYIEPTTGTELTMELTFQQTVSPGQLVYSDPFAILDWAWTYRVYVGIHKIVFDDGEVREIDPEEIRYYSLDIKS